MKHADVNQFAADGASNAIGSVSEYESLLRTARPNEVQFDVCYAHQNQCSGGHASGTLKFAEPVNTALGEILIKNHQIQVQICRSTNRMKVYHDVQKSHSCKPMLNPDPGNETCWDNFIEEAKRAVTFMGDVCETNVKLLGPGGDDCNLLNPARAAAKDYSRLTYTDFDKMILRQFECASGPEITFSKFTQDNRDTFSYVLFESRRTVAQSREDNFSMFNGKKWCLLLIIHIKSNTICLSDASHMSRTIDLRNRGQRTILVKGGSAIVSNTNARKYSQVIDANPLIVTYCDAYADDLEACLKLDEDKLPPALSVSTLLNPLFCLEAKNVGLGLMTQDQYTASRKLVVSMMHDIIDKCTVVMVEESSSENLIWECRRHVGDMSRQHVNVG